MNEATVIFSAVFLCGLTLKCGEALGSLIFYVIKQSHELFMKKKELKELMNARNSNQDERFKR